jgi:hypothetical protein
MFRNFITGLILFTIGLPSVHAQDSLTGNAESLANSVSSGELASNAIKSPQRIRELPERRNANSQQWLMSDGSIQASISPKPIFFSRWKWGLEIHQNSIGSLSNFRFFLSGG